LITSLASLGLLSGHIIQDEGVSVTQRGTINFTGSGVAVTDVAGVTTVTITSGGGGTGDFSSNTATSVDSEIVLFSGTAGKTGKRSTGSGRPKLTSGVMSLANIDLASEVSGNLPVANLGSGTSASSTTFWNGTGAWVAPIASNTSLQGKVCLTVGDATCDYPVANYADFGAAVNAAYAALPSAGGAIYGMPRYSYSTPIVFGTNGKTVTFFGQNASSCFWKYTPTSGNAITVNTGNPTGHLVSELCGFTLMGKSTLIAAGNTNTNTSVGIYYGGANGAPGVNTHDMNVNGFGTNWEIGQHAYMLSFMSCSNSGGNGGQASRGALLHINIANDSGERNNFINCNFTDPGNSSPSNALYITNAGTASNNFTNCSLDNVTTYVGSSNGTTNFYGCHFENAGTGGIYGDYIVILGASSDSSTRINVIGCEFANSSGVNTWTTIIRHGGQLYAVGNGIDNYNGRTVTNFVLHDLNNGTSSDHVSQTQVQGGALTNVIGGSGGVTHSRATGVATLLNVSNSYTIGLRPMASNTNEFFSGNSTVGTFDHSGNWYFAGTVDVGNASDTTISRSSAGVIAVEGTVIPSISSTNTLTNKRVTKRVTSTAGPGATPTINTDNCDVVHLTALAAAITSMTTNLTGTPVEGDELRIDFTDDGTARAITWGAKFEASTVALPATTVISTRLDCQFVWNTVTSKWRIVSVA